MCGNQTFLSNILLQVYDGSSDESDMVGKFCGTKTPSIIFLTSEDIYVHFQSATRHTGHGFTAVFSQSDGKHALQSHICFKFYRWYYY